MDKSQDAPPNITKASLAALTTLVLWGGTPVANKIAVAYVDGLSVGLFRSWLAGCTALMIVIVMRVPPPNTLTDRAILTISGVGTFAIWPILLSIGLTKTTAGHAALIMTVLPILTVLISRSMNKSMPGVGWWIGAAIALGGGAWLILQASVESAPNANQPSLIGDLIILGGCFVCSLGYVAGGKLSARYGALSITMWGLAAAFFVLTPFAYLLFGGTAWSAVPTVGWLSLAWLTFFSSLAGFMFWYYALGHGGIERMGTLQLGQPIISLIAASIILSELITAPLLAATAVILFGTYFAQRHLAD